METYLIDAAQCAAVRIKVELIKAPPQKLRPEADVRNPTVNVDWATGTSAPPMISMSGRACVWTRYSVATSERKNEILMSMFEMLQDGGVSSWDGNLTLSVGT